MKYVERIRNIVLDQLKNETVCIYLFGSWARGTQHHGSDVDIAIDFKYVPFAAAGFAFTIASNNVI